MAPRPAPSGPRWAGQGWAAPTCVMQGRPPTAVRSVHHAGRLGGATGHVRRSTPLAAASAGSTPAARSAVSQARLTPSSRPPTRSAAPALGPSGSVFTKLKSEKGHSQGLTELGLREQMGLWECLWLSRDWGSGEAGAQEVSEAGSASRAKSAWTLREHLAVQGAAAVQRAKEQLGFRDSLGDRGTAGVGGSQGRGGSEAGKGMTCSSCFKHCGRPYLAARWRAL